MYKIKLSDGTIIDNLELNGNNYIPKNLDTKVFKNNLDKVIITDKDGNVEEFYNQKVQFTKIGEIDTFILMEKDKDEAENERLLRLMADLTEIVLLGGV